MPYRIISETAESRKAYGEFETEIEAVNEMKKEARLAVDTMKAVSPQLDVTIKETPESCIVRLKHDDKVHQVANIYIVFTED